MIGMATIEEIKKLQAEDPDIGPVLQAKMSGIKPSSQEMVTVACRRPGRNSLSLCTDYENIKGINAATSSQNRERHLQFPAR